MTNDPPDTRTDHADAVDPWDARPFADPPCEPTMRERAAMVLGHAGRARELVGERPDLARGAGLVAAVAAVRMAVTAAGSERDYDLKREFLRSLPARLDPLRRDRLETLLAVASEGEADRRRLAGLGLGRCGVGVVPSLGPAPRDHPTASAGRAGQRDLAASRLDADLDAVMTFVARALREMGDLARRGASTEGVRRVLADVAFALCLGSAASAADADVRAELLGILHDAQREGEPARDVISAGATAERQRWEAEVAGSA